MFDFGFSELVVICVVALVVLGPTRLPGLVRKVGRWVGKARSMARDFREQLENEVNLDELNRVARQEPKPATRPPAPTADLAGGTAAGGAAATDAASSDAAAGDPEAPPPADNPTMAGSGYPYGMPTDTSASSADPAVTAHEPQPGDDDYSHAHAPGAAPEPWNPEADGTVPAAADLATAPEHGSEAGEDAAAGKADSRPA